MPINPDKIIYSAEERDRIAKFWNEECKNGDPPGLHLIVNYFSGGETSDPRTKIGHKVRKIINDLQIKPRTKSWNKIAPLELSLEEKEFIKNNIKENRAIDLARTLFPDRKIAPLGREVRAINSYLKEIGEYVVKKDEGEITDEIWKPPNTFHEVTKLVNSVCHSELSSQNATSYEKKSLEMTINFLHSPRFVQEINNYKTKEKRWTFLAEFVRSVFKKNDLSSEEISLTINWVSDIIAAADLNRLLEKLTNSLESITEDENGKFSQALAETIGKVTTNRNEVLKRQERIYQILNTARSKRTEDKESRQVNMAQLYEFFREEDNRKKMLKQAELLKEARSREIERIDSLDSVVMLSLGLSRSEIEN